MRTVNILLIILSIITPIIIIGVIYLLVPKVRKVIDVHFLAIYYVFSIAALWLIIGMLNLLKLIK
ncbi:MAG: hypothetical protein A2231_12820 [Candidatus Firestonebacteria bacterium RIFOXYA2_FULL_40_8]|nr:MAG: hypothetical protein A2231_12820 [Candidatus Firestonebacteria bacterium RIFOXYA2_FULL_40_8]